MAARQNGGNHDGDYLRHRLGNSSSRHSRVPEDVTALLLRQYRKSAVHEAMEAMSSEYPSDDVNYNWKEITQY